MKRFALRTPKIAAISKGLLWLWLSLRLSILYGMPAFIASVAGVLWSGYRFRKSPHDLYAAFKFYFHSFGLSPHSL
jgi:hypothetical protein